MKREQPRKGKENQGVAESPIKGRKRTRQPDEDDNKDEKRQRLDAPGGLAQ